MHDLWFYFNIGILIYKTYAIDKTESGQVSGKPWSLHKTPNYTLGIFFREKQKAKNVLRKIIFFYILNFLRK